MSKNSSNHTPKWCIPLTESRLWLVVLWATLLGTAGAGWWAAEDMFVQQGRAVTVILLPSGPVLESRRATMLKELEQASPPGSLRWIDPETLHQRLGSELDEATRKELLPGDAGWLPWTLEMRLTLPLESLSRLQAFAAQIGSNPNWTMYWDQQKLRELIGVRDATRMVIGSLALAVALLGLVALAMMPGSQAPWAMLGWSSLLVLTLVLGLWTAITSQLAFSPPVTALGIGLGAGFVLAGPIAAVIKKRSPKKRVSLSIDEGFNERT